MRTFTITVNSVNDAPSGADDTISIDEDGSHTFAATDFGFSDANDTPADGFASVIITSLPSGGTLELNMVAVIAGQEIAVDDLDDLVYTPAANAFGAAYDSLDFKVRDDGGTVLGGVDLDPSADTLTFDIEAVNDEPALDTIGNETVNEDAPAQTVSLTGIGSGAANESQVLTITATSSNPGLIPDPTVTYTSPNGTGSLNYTPVADQHGTAVITVTVQDDGGTANGGDDTFVRTFTITVNSVNDAPTLNDSPTKRSTRMPPQQTVALTGIGSGAANETQTLTSRPNHRTPA